MDTDIKKAAAACLRAPGYLHIERCIVEELILAETTPSANAMETTADPAPVQPPRRNVVPWWLVIGLFAFLCIGLYLSMTQFTKGRFIYPLDDTYIEMATAKNLVLHGTWGVTRHEFTSSASSPLYIVLLAAGYLVAGPNEWWPLVLASFFGGVSLLVARRVLRGASLPIQIAALSGIALLVPLHVMAVTGMEHSLHIALALLFLHLSAKLIAGERQLDWMLLAVTAAMVSARYEGLFAAGTVCLLLLVWKRKPFESLAVLLARQFRLLLTVSYPHLAGRICFRIHC